MQYALLAVFLVSLVSLVGIFTLSIATEKLKKMLIFVIAFSAGTLMGDAFLHLLPETVQEFGYSNLTAFALL